MYEIHFRIKKQNTDKNLLRNLNMFYLEPIKKIEINNNKIYKFEDIPDFIPLNVSVGKDNSEGYIIINYADGTNLNLNFYETEISTLYVTLETFDNRMLDNLKEVISLKIGKIFDDMKIRRSIGAREKDHRNITLSPYWIQLISQDLFEKINAITPVKKLFENENGVVMQLTEEPTSADNPEHLEKVIKIYEGLFPDFKADRTKLNELKARQEASAMEDYKKTQPKSFLSKLFGN